MRCFVYVVLTFISASSFNALQGLRDPQRDFDQALNTGDFTQAHEIIKKNTSYRDNFLNTLAAFKKPEAYSLVENIISQGTNFLSTDQLKTIALVKAASNNNKPLAEFLVSKGAQVNSEANDGLTPLMTAAKKRFLGMIQLLLSRGANVNYKNKFGETVIDIIRNYKRDDHQKKIDKALESYRQTPYRALSALSGYTASDIPPLPRDIVSIIGNYIGLHNPQKVKRKKESGA